MSDVTTIVIVAVVVVVLALIAFLIIRRQRYVRALRSRGWTFETSPRLEWVLDHHAPPLGLGFVRKVDEGISGTTSAGIPFRVFEYAKAEGGPDFDERLASLQLPLPLPEVFVTTDTPRSGVRWPVVEIDPRVRVWAADPAYARAVLSSSMLGAIAAFGQAGHRVDLSIDGAHLVAVGAPKDPDELQAYLEDLAQVAQSVDASGLASFAITPPPPGFTFYGRPDWLLISRDDALIGQYGLTTAGFGHETEKVIRGYNDGLPIDAFIHRWKTHRIETYTDSEGRTQTRTVTEHHSEIVTAVNLPFSLPMLSIEGGWGGEKVRFESEEFNDRFTVRTSTPKVAYDVIHPRTMEWLMANPPPGFKIEGQVMRFSVARHDTRLIGDCADFAHAFFARVPSFVWKDLQITPPRFRAVIEAA
jgi:hypothetical protein